MGDFTKAKECWDSFQKVEEQLMLNDDEKALLKHISNLNKPFTQKISNNEIKKLLQKCPQIFSNAKLLYATQCLYTFYNFPIQIKRSINKIFERAFHPDVLLPFIDKAPELIDY